MPDTDVATQEDIFDKVEKQSSPEDVFDRVSKSSTPSLGVPKTAVPHGTKSDEDYYQESVRAEHPERIPGLSVPEIVKTRAAQAQKNVDLYPQGSYDKEGQGVRSISGAPPSQPRAPSSGYNPTGKTFDPAAPQSPEAYNPRGSGPVSPYSTRVDGQNAYNPTGRVIPTTAPKQDTTPLPANFEQEHPELVRSTIPTAAQTIARMRRGPTWQNFRDQSISEENAKLGGDAATNIANQSLAKSGSEVRLTPPTSPTRDLFSRKEIGPYKIPLDAFGKPGEYAEGDPHWTIPGVYMGLDPADPKAGQPGHTELVPIDENTGKRYAPSPQAVQRMAPGLRERFQSATQVQGDVAAGGAHVVSGLERIYDANDPMAGSLSDPNDTKGNRLFGGASETLGGGMQVASPLFLKAMLLKPIPTTLGLGVGAGSSEIAGLIAKHYGASPEEEGFVRDVAFFIPTALGTAVGLKPIGNQRNPFNEIAGRGTTGFVAGGWETDAATGKPAINPQTGNPIPRVGVIAGRTSEGFRVVGKFGGKSFDVVIPWDSKLANSSTPSTPYEAPTSQPQSEALVVGRYGQATRIVEKLGDINPSGAPLQRLLGITEQEAQSLISRMEREGLLRKMPGSGFGQLEWAGKSQSAAVPTPEVKPGSSNDIDYQKRVSDFEDSIVQPGNYDVNGNEVPSAPRPSGPVTVKEASGYIDKAQAQNPKALPDELLATARRMAAVDRAQPTAETPPQKLTPGHIQAMREVISAIPPEARPAALKELETNVGKWLVSTGTAPNVAPMLAKQIAASVVPKPGFKIQPIPPIAPAGSVVQPAAKTIPPVTPVVSAENKPAGPVPPQPAKVSPPLDSSAQAAIQQARGELGASAAGRDQIQKRATEILRAQAAPTPQAQPPTDQYQQAIALTQEFGKGSTTLLQRRLKIGYADAANLIDRMTADGILKKGDGTKPRELAKAGKGDQIIATTDSGTVQGQVVSAHANQHTDGRRLDVLTSEGKIETVHEKEAEIQKVAPTNSASEMGIEEEFLRSNGSTFTPGADDMLAARRELGKGASAEDVIKRGREITLDRVRGEEKARRSGEPEIIPPDEKDEWAFNPTEPSLNIPEEIEGATPKGELPPAPAAQPERRALTTEGQRAERRQDVTKRQRVSDMTPEERATQLLTSDKTQLPNLRAFEEDNDSPLAQSHPHVGYADLDDFKTYNTELGHESVDDIVFPALGDMFRSALNKEPKGSIKVYHRSGDEFNFRATTPEAIGRVASRVKEQLAGTTFEATQPGGTIVTKKGTGLSYGTGVDHKSAEAAAGLDKAARKAAGLRTGTRDSGAVAETSAQGNPTHSNGDTGRQAVRSSQEIKPLTETISQRLNGKRSGIIGTVTLPDKTQLVLSLRPDPSSVGTYSAVVSNGTNSVSYRMQYKGGMSLGDLRAHLEEYLNIDSPGHVVAISPAGQPAQPVPAVVPASPKTFESHPKTARTKLSANQLSDFQIGRDEVVREAGRTYVVDTSGSHARTEVASDAMTPEVRANMEKLNPAQREKMLEATRSTPYLSDEGRAERLAILEQAAQGYRVVEHGHDNFSVVGPSGADEYSGARNRKWAESKADDLNNKTVLPVPPEAVAALPQGYTIEQPSDLFNEAWYKDQVKHVMQPHLENGGHIPTLPELKEAYAKYYGKPEHEGMTMQDLGRMIASNTGAGYSHNLGLTEASKPTTSTNPFIKKAADARASIPSVKTAKDRLGFINDAKYYDKQAAAFDRGEINERGLKIVQALQPAGISKALNPGDTVHLSDGRTGKTVGTYAAGARSVKVQVGDSKSAVEVIPARNLIEPEVPVEALAALPIEFKIESPFSATPVSTPKSSEVYTPGNPITGTNGATGRLLTPSGEQQVRYKLVEASDLIPSHDPLSFVQSPDYPAGVQERQYHNSKEAQSRVIQQAQNFEPEYVINTNPDAVNGAPVIMPDGLVLGGNSRAMTVQRLYRSGKGAEYSEPLADGAGQFKLTSKDVERFEQPVLVRELINPPKTMEELRRLASDLNKSMTGALATEEKAVSAGKSISQETLSAITQIAENIGTDATLKDAMKADGQKIIAMLVKDGAITERERPQFVDTTSGGITIEGKAFIEKALRGRIVDDAELMDRVPRSVFNKLDSSLANLASLGSRDDAYNILPILKKSLEAHAEMAERGLGLKDYLSQSGLFGREENPAVDAITKLLAGKTPEIRRAIQQFTQDANADKSNTGQGFLLGNKPDPDEAFNAAFSAKVQPVDMVVEKPKRAPAEKKEPTSKPPARHAVETPAEKAPQVYKPQQGDIVEYQGQRYEVGSGRGDAVRLQDPSTHIGSIIASNDELSLVDRPSPQKSAGWKMRELSFTGDRFAVRAGRNGTYDVVDQSTNAVLSKGLTEQQATREAEHQNGTRKPPPLAIPEQGISTPGAIADLPEGWNAHSGNRDWEVRDEHGRTVVYGALSQQKAIAEAQRKLGNEEINSPVAEKWLQERDQRIRAEKGKSQDTGTPALINAIYSKLKAGESLGNVTELNKLAEQHLGASRTSGEWSPKDVYDAMEAGVNKYLLHIGESLMQMRADIGLSHIRALMTKITSQGIRTDEQIKNQQFSTPPTESYVVAKVAGLKPSDVVLEPSAGNGGLAVWPKAIGAEVHVNEIAPRRQQMLEAAGFDKPTAHDGEIINSLLDQSVKPTVILMNPPFSASAIKSYEARNNNLYGFNHVDSALQRLEPNGRLVAILGGGQANDPNGGASLTSGAAAKWFERIADRYNVRANIRINGKEYQKYGTNFATRIIVIDKDGPTPSRNTPGQVKSWASVKQANVNTLEEAYNALSDVANSRPEILAPSRDGESFGQGKPRVDLAKSQGAGVGSNRPGVRSQSETGGAVQPAHRSLGPTGEPPGNQSGAGLQRDPLREPETRSSGSGETEAGRRVGGDHQDGDGERQVPGRVEDLKLEQENRLSKAEEADTSAYVTYRPSLKGPVHPASIVETKTMATVPLPPITYKPSLPKSVIEQSGLSAIQLEAVSLAGQQNDIVLPGGARSTLLIGDGTGVGKGREAAGILLDNWNKGRTRLVWVSEKWDLMQDAIRDLKGIGAHELAATMKPLGKMSAASPIDHRGILFTTYALMRSGDKKGNTRISQIEQWIRGNDEGDGAHVITDEAHNLKNAVAANAQQVSQIGKTVKEFMQRNPKLRSTSLSATAATDVINLGYLDRLGLWGAGTPFPLGFTQFANEIAAGGMSAMEMIARELKSQGKYVARTLSFKGVTYNETEHVITPEQKEVYRSAVKAWQSVQQKAEDTIKNTTNGGGKAKGNFMSLFYGAQQRFFNVLLTTLKIPTAVEKANQALADGKSVVISLVNTNEAAQNREKIKYRDREEDEEIPEYDFGPGEMLIDMVREHYPTQQWIDDVNSDGQPVKTAVFVKDSAGRDIPMVNPEAVRQRDELLAELKQNLNMPANPLDILVESLGGHKKVAEITGRKERYDQASGKFVSRGDPNIPRDKLNVSEAKNFQDGKKRVAILSSAGGTGISLHADNNAINKQTRYHITLQLGWQADKGMQMLGRTQRSNQAQPPEYDLLKSNLGGENRFVSSMARRLGSLEALGKGQTKTNEGTEMMSKVNFETDQGRQATNAFYVRLMQDRPVPGTEIEGGQPLTGMQVLTDLGVLKPSGTGGGMTVPPADRTNVTRLLNRLLALDPDVQNGVYDYFYDIFEATVKQAVEDGTLDTGVKTLPGDEFTVKEQRSIAKDPTTGAETFYYPVEAQVRTNRVSVKELEKRMKSARDQGPTIVRDKEGKVALVVKAKPIVHANGHQEDASYISYPGKGNYEKVPNNKLRQWTPVEEWAKDNLEKAQREVQSAQGTADWRKRYVDSEAGSVYYKSAHESAQKELEAAKQSLAEAEIAAKDVDAHSKELWKQQYEAAPAHTSQEHHLVGGAVMRYWNPIREATGRMNIYTTTDAKTGQRVVGIDVPPGQIRQLLERISGNQNTVNGAQIYNDVLRNNTPYELEQGIQVKRGRVAGKQVVQLIPGNNAVAQNLKNLGVIYEKGALPVYYLPNSERAVPILDKVLEQYPAKSAVASQATEGQPEAVESTRATKPAAGSVEALTKQRDKLRKKLNAPVTDSELAQFFEPGKIVPGYAGPDKVIGFHSAAKGDSFNRWHVDVIRVGDDGKPLPGEKTRRHATQPSIKEIRDAGMRSDVRSRIDELNQQIDAARGGQAPIQDSPGERGFARLNTPSVLAKATPAIEKVLGKAVGSVIDAAAPAVKALIDKVDFRDPVKLAEKKDAKAQAKGLEKELHDLNRHHEARVIQAERNLIAAAKDSTPGDRLAVDQFIDSQFVPGSAKVNLSPGQQAILDKYVDPMRLVNHVMWQELKDAELPIAFDPNYLPRVVQDRPSQLETAQQGRRGSGKANILSKNAAALKQRVMYGIEDPSGNRAVVSFKDGKVTGWDQGQPTDLGTADNFVPGEEFEDKSGNKWKIGQATKDEIEADTGLTYYRDPVATVTSSFIALSKALEAKNFLEQWKESPEFKRIAMVPKKGEFPPQGWEGLKAGGALSGIFRGHVFEPRTAEVLQGLADKMNKDNSPSILGKLAEFAQSSVLLNPIMHGFNMADFAVVNRGMVDNANVFGAARGISAAARAIKAVTTRGPDFVKALDAGAHLLSHKPHVSDLNEKFVEVMATQMAQNPGFVNKMREYMGLTKGDDPISALRRYSHAAAFASNDIFFMQSVYEHQAKGMTFEDAVKATNKIFPDYQIPTRVLDSKFIGDVMRVRGLSWFNGYHLGRAKTYKNIFENSFKPGIDPQERGHALSQLAMLALMVGVGYEVIDKILKRLLNEPNARERRFGLSSLPNDLIEFRKGNKTFGQVANSQFTLSSLISAGIDIGRNRDYAGNYVYDPEGDNKAWESAKYYGVNIFGPAQQIQSYRRDNQPGAGKRAVAKFMLGTSFPRSETMTEAEKLTQRITRMKLPPRTPEEREQSQAKAIEKKGRIAAGDEQDIPYLEGTFKRLGFPDARKVWAVMTPAEQESLWNAFEKKRQAALTKALMEQGRYGKPVPDYLYQPAELRGALPLTTSPQPAEVRQ